MPDNYSLKKIDCVILAGGKGTRIKKFLGNIQNLCSNLMENTLFNT